MTALIATAKEQTHCMPVDDLREHICDPSCWCKPTPDDEEPSLWIHRSMDRREEYEQGRKPL